MKNFISQQKLKKKLAETKINQMKETAIKEIKDNFNKNSSRFS